MNAINTPCTIRMHTVHNTHSQSNQRKNAKSLGETNSQFIQCCRVIAVPKSSRIPFGKGSNVLSNNFCEIEFFRDGSDIGQAHLGARRQNADNY